MYNIQSLTSIPLLKKKNWCTVTFSVCLMNPRVSSLFNWSFISSSSTRHIEYNGLEIGTVPRTMLMENSTALSGGNPEKYKKTSIKSDIIWISPKVASIIVNTLLVKQVYNSGSSTSLLPLKNTDSRWFGILKMMLLFRQLITAWEVLSQSIFKILSNLWVLMTRKFS